MPPSTPNTLIVSIDIIRQIFNENGFLSNVRRGFWSKTLRSNSHLAKTSASLPYCTNSQIWVYFNEHHEAVAIVHQYLRPDGSIGASGLPDPKWLKHDGRFYAIKGTSGR